MALKPECNFPEGLQEIGNYAFYATRLKEVILTNTCQTFVGSGHFAFCIELEKVRFPEGINRIPNAFVDDCISLKEFNIPNSVEVIGLGAFRNCASLETLTLPYRLKSIESDAFRSCKNLKTIHFPSTLETLGRSSCVGLNTVGSIYCAAPIPPVCPDANIELGRTPFGVIDSPNSTPKQTPVYVPIGSGELYRNAWAWSYLTNIIETDEFPPAGLYFATPDEESQDNATYDMLGRKVDTLIPGSLYIRNGQKFVHRQ